MKILKSANVAGYICVVHTNLRISGGSNGDIRGMSTPPLGSQFLEGVLHALYYSLHTLVHIPAFVINSWICMICVPDKKGLLCTSLSSNVIAFTNKEVSVESFPFTA